MLGRLIFLAILYAIYWAGYHMILKDYEKRIKIVIKCFGEKNPNLAISLRKQLQKRRRCLLIGIIGVMSIIFSTLVIFSDNRFLEYSITDNIAFWLFCFVFCCFICIIPIRNNSELAESLLGNISSLSLKEVLSSKKPFALYLRGFKNDEKRPVAAVLDKPLSKGFSEYLLVKGLKRHIKRVYCIGNPQETDSPLGATRVFIEGGWNDGDEKWKGGVLSLMEAAQEIIVRPYYTNNCSWELEKAMSLYPDKTYLIIDSLEDYYRTRDYFAGVSSTLLLPEIPDLPDDRSIIQLWKRSDGTWHYRQLKKKRRGYVRQVHLWGQNNRATAIKD